MSQWKVDFPRLARILIQTEIEDTVTARHERMGTRLIRILHNKGKLDEKQVSNFGMTPPKTIRSTLTGMQEAGFVEIQEVPKDTSRQPSRTMYLWFYDQQRCRQLLLTDTYKAMARILQRIKVERAKVQTVIDKAERTDVVGHEEQYLSKMERQALRDWSQTEEKLLIQLGRQDNLVATLRDFIGPLNS
jgi:DNA-directed RNA polymerase III subunit RPC3